MEKELYVSSALFKREDRRKVTFRLDEIGFDSLLIRNEHVQFLR